MQYISFKVDSPLKSITNIVIASENGCVKDARSDAISAARSFFKFGAARIGEDASFVYGIDPVCDEPIKHAVSNGKQWAWFGVSV